MSGIGDALGNIGTGIQNAYVNLMGPAQPQAPLSYDQQLMQVKRQQALADALRQQSMDPIQTYSSGGIQAPIPWTAILAKALQGLGANAKEGRAERLQQEATAADQARVDALLAGINGNVTHPGAPAVAPVQTQVSGAMPQLPGQPAPTGPAPTAQLSVGGQQGTGPTQGPPGLQQQLAMLAAAQGGPAVQGFKQAYLPMVQGQLQAQQQSQMPMSVADQQRIQAQADAQLKVAEAENKLPMTAAQTATNSIAQQNLQIERQKANDLNTYRKAMTGQGLLDDGTPAPAVQNWVKLFQTGAVSSMNQVPAPLRPAVAAALAGAPKDIFTPQAGQRFTTEAQKITAPYVKLPQYQLTAQGLPYLQKIDAALKHPGSVGDQELLDSFTKLSTAGNAVTEAQVHLVTQGQSLGDWYNVQMAKLKNGGVLSDNQRQQIKAIANDSYNNFKRGYQPVYDQATTQLRAAGIPEHFWTIPDLNKLNAGQGIGGGSGATQFHYDKQGNRVPG